MNEQSKATIRRRHDWRYGNRWLVGRGIDIGCGPDPLKKDDWENVTEVVPFDIMYGSGDAMFMEGVADDSFDFVLSSHCLEHVKNPVSALRNWVRILKPGGFAVVTVPEELLYESGQWPSRYNSDHKSSFTMRPAPLIPYSVNVLWMLWKSGAELEHLTLLTEAWDPSKLGLDQTLGPAECAIEFVMRKPRPNQPW